MAERLNRVQKIQIIKRRKRRFLLFGFSFLLVALIAGVMFLSRAGFWTIQNISVNGFTGDSSQIESLAREVLSQNRFLILSGANSFIFSREDIKNTIEQNVVTVEGVSVSRSGLNAINIDITEREPSMLVKNVDSSDVFVVDDEGVVFENALNAPDLPVLVLEQPIAIGTHIDNPEQVAQFVFFVSQSRASGVVIKQVVPTKGRLECILDSGVVLIIDPTHDLAWSLRGIEVLSRELTKTGEWPSFLDKVEYIDFRELPKVFYKEKKQ